MPRRAPFEALGQGIWRSVGLPRYGRQDLGYAPGGAQDRFSFQTGNILLDNESAALALEMVLPPALRFLTDCCFVLTGGAHRDVTLEARSGRNPVRHGEVCFAEKGSILTFGLRSYGFRSYLCYRRAPRDPSRIVGRARGSFAAVSSWHDPDGKIRCLKGPEFNLLPDPAAFLAEPWETSAALDDMGVRLLSHTAIQIPSVTGMVSAPVSDGTVQLTPEGPIVLMRERQTVGGYPRVLNVIGADVDVVAQYAPRETIRFRLVGIPEARRVLRRRDRDLSRLAERFGHRSRLVGVRAPRSASPPRRPRRHR